MEYLVNQLNEIKKAVQEGKNGTTVTVETSKSYELSRAEVITDNVVTETISEYTQPITHVRSRNITFDAKSLKPVTKFYPFFSEINISNYITPKLLEIEMVSGTFEVGEIVESSPTFVTNKLRFRLCSLNHKTGVYDVPETTFSINPYTQQPLGEFYSASSTILNVDVNSLSLPSESDFYGSASLNMELIGQSSGAVAKVSKIRLVSDRNGRLIGSFFVPDPSKFGNIKFINGVNVLSLLDVDSLRILSESESFAEETYTSSGLTVITETDILTTRNVNITFPSLITKVGNDVKVNSSVIRGSSQATAVDKLRDEVLQDFANEYTDGQISSQNLHPAGYISSLERNISNYENQIERYNDLISRRLEQLNVDADSVIANDDRTIQNYKIQIEKIQTNIDKNKDILATANTKTIVEPEIRRNTSSENNPEDVDLVSNPDNLPKDIFI